MVNKIPADQTNDEWLADYDGRPAPPPTPEPQLNKRCFVFDSWRTTKRGSVILAFEDIETGEELVKYFNVNLYHQRGQKVGKGYRTGQGGQFYPKERSSFRKWWKKVVKANPRAWTRVHQELRPRLKAFLFTAPVITAQQSNGTEYLKIKGDPEVTKVLQKNNKSFAIFSQNSFTANPHEKH